MKWWELKYHWYSYSDQLRYFTKAARNPGQCERCGTRILKKHLLCWQCRQWERSDDGQQWLKVEEERLKERYDHTPMYSICKANGKFFWLATPTHERYWSALFEGTTKNHWHSGYESSHDAALAAATLAYPGGVEDRPHCAIHYHRQLAARRHFNRMKAKPSHVRSGVMVDYLWSDHSGYSDYDNRWYESWCRVRIIRKTAKRVFIARGRLDERNFNPKEYEEHPEWFHTIALDRQKLEREGRVWSRTGRGWGEYFYTDEGKRNHEAEYARWHSAIPDFLAALGLAKGSTEKDVRRAYRRKSREAHPDGGGSHEAFIKLRDQFDMALRYARCNPSASAA
jgi:hypothetical protein